MQVPESRHSNLVENLGYQDERVHTGWIRWLLNDARESTVARQAFSILWEYAQPVGEKIVPSESITGISYAPAEEGPPMISIPTSSGTSVD